jgi:hypothetical protein
VNDMEPIEVAIVNQSSVLTDEDVAEGVAALQKQVSEDFAPVWHIDACLKFVGADLLHAKFPTAWGLILLDSTDDARQLGYHDFTSSGLPLATVYAKDVKEGQDWTHAASHELLEMLADPDIDLAVYSRPDALTLRILAREVCDPCAAYDDGYTVDGRHVSDFVFPVWFQPDALNRFRNPAARTRFDERGLIQAPLDLRPGGYIGVFDPGSCGWTVLGNDTGQTESLGLGTRLERRSTARNRWQFSDMAWTP